jgi:hypothetical protein
MKRALLIITLLFAVTGLVVAQEQGDAQNGEPSDGAQPGAQSQGEGPGVGHISMIQGDVSVQRGDSGDWVATSLNTPVSSGDTLATSARSRAEIQLDFADILRLSEQSQAKIADLSRNHIQMQIGQGKASLSLFQGGQAEVEVDTPNVTIRPNKNGRYSFEVISDSETNVIVREGEAEVSTSQGSTTVKEGELISIRGTDDPEYKTSEATGADDWDRWNEQRDHQIQNAEGVRRTNPYYTGTQDLDTYGHWVYVPNYGQVWTPYDQSPAWAPYQAGRWVWEPYYGWTWASYEPWGWAPYHYGRWFFYGSAWYWWPGPITPFYRPVWGPAFVGFIGFGAHVSFGFGFGSIGWFPLAPFEVCHPWWGGGFHRFGVFGAPVGFHGNLGLAFTNPRVRVGITTVAAEHFGHGPAGFGHGVDVATLRGAHMANGNLGIVPTRESLAPTNRGFRPAPAGIRSSASTRFVTRTQSSASTPSFHEQTARLQDAIRAHGGEGQFGGRGQSGSNSGFGRNSVGTAAGDRPGFHGFSNGGTAGGRNEGRTDRPANAGQTFGNNQRGMNNAGGNRDGYRTFDNRGGQSVVPQNRDRAPSGGAGMSGGSRPQVDLSRRIVVPRGSNSSYGGRNSAPGYYGGSRSGGGYSGGHSGGYSGGHSGGYSGGHSGGYSGGHGGGGSHSSGGNSGGSHGGGGHR